MILAQSTKLLCLPFGEFVNKRILAWISFFVIASFFLGIFIVQESEWFKKIIHQKMVMLFAQELNVDLHAQVRSINIFKPRVVLTRISVQPRTKNIDPRLSHDMSWKWEASNLSVSFSWLDFLFFRKAQLQLYLNDLNVFSKIENNVPSILEHLQVLFGASKLSVPVILKQLHITEGKIHVQDSDLDGMNMSIMIHGTMQRLEKSSKLVMSLEDGNLEYCKKNIVKNVAGNITAEFFDNQDFTFVPSLSFIPTYLNEETIYYFRGKSSGNLKDHSGQYAFHTIDSTCQLNNINLIHRKNEWFAILSGTCHLKLVKDIIHNLYDIKTPEINGLCNIDLTIQVPDFNIQNIETHGSIELNNAQYQKLAINSFKFSGSLSHSLLQSSLYLSSNIGNYEGDFFCDLKTANGYAQLVNKGVLRPLSNSMWQVNPDYAQITLQSNYAKNTHILTYVANLIQEKTDDKIGVSGEIVIDPQRITMTGSMNELNLQAQCDRQPIFQLINARVYKTNNHEQIDLCAIKQQKNKLDARIDYSCLSYFFPELLQEEMIGDGAFFLTAIQKEHILSGQILFKEGYLRLPYTSNFIKDGKVQFSVNLHTYTMNISDLSLNLYRGTIRSLNGSVVLNSFYPFSINAMLPLLLDKTFLQLGNLQAEISGQGLYTIDFSKQLLSGNFILKNGHLDRSNIDSSEKVSTLVYKNEQSNTSSPLFFDLHCIIKKPFELITPVLDAQITGNIDIDQSYLQPRLKGKLDLSDGSIKFPHKNLLLSNAHLYFSGNTQQDPLIDIVAKNRIKQYNIQLTATGSLNSPQLTFESQPTLTEDQIVALLLVGSENESLNEAAPTLVINNLTSFLTNYFVSKNKKIPSVLQQALDKIRLVPTIKEKEGSSNLGGGIEIDINDRWRTIIQKDLDSSSKARFEMEYLLTDDVRLRGIRDQRGNFGGEVEVRWKL